MPPVSLAPKATGLKGPIGIDYHEPTEKLILSVNYSSGLPHNFELLDENGVTTPVTPASGFKDEIKIAAVRSSLHQGGFAAGEVFTGTGVPGVIARISPDLAAVTNPWVILPGETGTLRGGLFQDRYGVYGGDLIVVTTAGNVWRVTSAGIPTKVAAIGNVTLEGVTTVPNDPAKYGPWAGKIIAGGGLFFAIDGTGEAKRYELGIAPEDIDIIEDGEHFFGVEYDSANGTIWTAPPAQFAGMEGDFLVPVESGQLWHVRWDAGSNSFQTAQVAEVHHWEHVTFAPPKAPVFQYAAKFVCGRSNGEVVSPGVYYTAINVHNPAYERVKFRKKIAVALPGEKPGPVSKFFKAELGPDQALEIDCPDIFQHAPVRAEFLKGFVVIESDDELDVVAVYTAGGRDQQVQTMHIERVNARRRRRPFPFPFWPGPFQPGTFQPGTVPGGTQPGGATGGRTAARFPGAAGGFVPVPGRQLGGSLDAILGSWSGRIEVPVMFPSPPGGLPLSVTVNPVSISVDGSWMILPMGPVGYPTSGDLEAYNPGPQAEVEFALRPANFAPPGVLPHLLLFGTLIDDGLRMIGYARMYVPNSNLPAPMVGGFRLSRSS